jgi:hypothetical protein
MQLFNFVIHHRIDNLMIIVIDDSLFFLQEKAVETAKHKQGARRGKPHNWPKREEPRKGKYGNEQI